MLTPVPPAQRTRFSRPLLAAAILSAVCGLAPAQVQQYPGGFQPPDAHEKIIADVNFKGGTVHQYLEYLRTAAGEGGVNAVVSDELGAATLPAIRLRNVTGVQATAIIDDLLSEQRDVKVDQIGSGIAGTVVSLRFEHQGNNPFNSGHSPIAIFQVNDIVAPGKDTGPLTSGSLPVNTVLTAIENAITLIGGTPPEIKYHADSGLLLVKGSSAHTQAANEVLINLRSSVGRVDSMGGGKWQRSWTLVHTTAADITSAFREVFPPGSDGSEAVRVEAGDTDRKVTITAPKNMAVAADVLVRYVDRAPAVNQDVIRLEAMLQSARNEQSRSEEQASISLQRLEAQRDMLTQELSALRVQLDAARRDLEALKTNPQRK